MESSLATRPGRCRAASLSPMADSTTRAHSPSRCRSVRSEGAFLTGLRRLC